MSHSFTDNKYNPAWYTHLSYTWDKATILRAELTPVERGLYLDRAEKAALRVAEYLAQEWVNDVVSDGADNRTILRAVKADIKDVIVTLEAWLESLTAAISYEEKHDTITPAK